jgi:hypothetical protein
MEATRRRNYTASMLPLAEFSIVGQEEARDKKEEDSLKRKKGQILWLLNLHPQRIKDMRSNSRRAVSRKGTG